MNSDEGKLYMKIVAFDDIYNFVVQSFFYLKSSSYSNNRYTIQILTTKMTPNGNTLNYKVVDLVESYNLYIKFTSI
jgi:hypothetical protein